MFENSIISGTTILNIIVLSRLKCKITSTPISTSWLQWLTTWFVAYPTWVPMWPTSATWVPITVIKMSSKDFWNWWDRFFAILSDLCCSFKDDGVTRYDIHLLQRFLPKESESIFLGWNGLVAPIPSHCWFYAKWLQTFGCASKTYRHVNLIKNVIKKVIMSISRVIQKMVIWNENAKVWFLFKITILFTLKWVVGLVVFRGWLWVVFRRCRWVVRFRCCYHVTFGILDIGDVSSVLTVDVVCYSLEPTVG